ncbi:glycosyltransferase family 2 protein (plasmid) [Rhizobium sp. 32-5/1]|uniref:glycosyltransferase family 2 protein n=1 Tax=Rhizobium sp. 32-5/1 TaxID=3019602 RepID=UPI00240E9663|nr:glycosyltransferase family 2 protein [Rhizobium sp. 32-5/1]WEZ85287.1 glycosyltransferase family 2 protein [Rhizobium sp. 32-5/1]
MEQDNHVCVVIAAKNAGDTIARAIRSSLNQVETTEVLVIDDGSSDGTAKISRGADDGTGRLRVLSFETNRGPAAARNHAIAQSKSPIIAILDADDFFFPDRLKNLLAQKDWDFIADNIAFVDEEKAADAHLRLDAFPPAPRKLTLSEFIQGNISKRGVRRGEIGFLKPLMRRSFLDRHDLRYRDELRLGEDYDLYARALTKGAHYKIIHSCGYGAVVRGNSLSGSHRTIDLKRLFEADKAMLAQGGLAPEVRKLISQHERHIRGRYELREFLDIKSEAGSMAALGHVARRPIAIPAIVSGIWNDKTERFRSRSAEAPMGLGGDGALRYLLQPPSSSSRPA